MRELENPDYVYEQVIRMLVRMAEYGLVHCDLNEFNLMVDEDENVTMIDFPQMVSVSHPNAKMYFERDAQCLRIYFARKFGVSEETGLMPLPVFEGAATSHRHTHRDGGLCECLAAEVWCVAKIPRF